MLESFIGSLVLTDAGKSAFASGRSPRALPAVASSTERQSMVICPCIFKAKRTFLMFWMTTTCSCTSLEPALSEAATCVFCGQGYLQRMLRCQAFTADASVG